MPPVLGVAGAGLIGGSIALRAAELGWTVGIYEPDAAHRAAALARLAASAAPACFAVGSFAELAARSETLVLAAPLDATLAQLAELEGDPPPGLELVLDVASVKAPVAVAGARVRGFVPTHPIAGSERSGPDAARAGLFAGRAWSYDPAVPEEARERAIRFILAMGAEPVPVASVEHDRLIALTSHLPQVTSVALAALLAPALDADDGALALCGTGIRSMLRLAGSSWSVWAAVLRANAVPVAQEVRRLAAILTGVADALENDAPQELERRFAEAAIVAARLAGNVPATDAVTSFHTNANRIPDER